MSPVLIRTVRLKRPKAGLIHHFGHEAARYGARSYQRLLRQFRMGASLM